MARQTHGTCVGGCRPGPVGGHADTRNMCGWVQAWTSGWPCRHTEHVWVGARLDQQVAMQTHGTRVGGCRPGPVGGHAADIWSLCVCSKHGTAWNVYRTQLLRSSGQTAWCRADHGPIYLLVHGAELARRVAVHGVTVRSRTGGETGDDLDDCGQVHRVLPIVMRSAINLDRLYLFHVTGTPTCRTKSQSDLCLQQFFNNLCQSNVNPNMFDKQPSTSTT